MHASMQGVEGNQILWGCVSIHLELTSRSRLDGQL